MNTSSSGAAFAPATTVCPGLRPDRSFKNLLGPYAPLAVMMLAGMILLSASRLALVMWLWPRVEASGLGWEVLWHGVRVDLIQVSLLAVLPILVAPLLAHRFGWAVWRSFTTAWAIGGLTLLVFLEIVTPAFILEYDVRPNRLFVEYLIYPREVVTMLWRGFKLPVVVAISVTALSVVLTRRLMRTPATQVRPWRWWIVWLSWPLIVLALALAIRSTLDHRPVNPASFALSSDTLVNSLILNSTWSVAHALHGLRNENVSSEIYGKLDTETMLEVVRDARQPLGAPTAFVDSAQLPTLTRLTPTANRTRPLNLVIILEESLGATFVESLGGLPVTPELERLKQEGWWFERLYATGTRSVRGIEAVVTGFPPTPAQSVVKLAKAQGGFTTLAAILEREGYRTSFIYGGEAHFDNMRGFFMANGFQTVIDQNDYPNPVFKGSWGVSDEDLFDRTHQELLAQHQTDTPFFTLVFTSSNHSPFEFPDGRIELFNPEKATDNNAVKYADYALGRFIDQARSSAYWQDTLFLIVADHDIRVRGEELVPIERFHIPGLILGADVQARRIQTVASQIDLPVTMLSLMGIETEHPMIGRDLSAEAGTLPGRAMMQYENLYAWMEGDEVVVLRPEHAPSFGRFDPTHKRLEETPAPPHGEVLATRALAHVQLGSWLYRTERYRLPDAETGTARRGLNARDG